MTDLASLNTVHHSRGLLVLMWRFPFQSQVPSTFWGEIGPHPLPFITDRTWSFQFLVGYFTRCHLNACSWRGTNFVLKILCCGVNCAFMKIWSTRERGKHSQRWSYLNRVASPWCGAYAGVIKVRNGTLEFNLECSVKFDLNCSTYLNLLSVHGLKSRSCRVRNDFNKLVHLSAVRLTRHKEPRNFLKH